MARRTYRAATSTVGSGDQTDGYTGSAGEEPIELGTVDIEAFDWDEGTSSEGTSSEGTSRTRRPRSDAGQKRGPRKGGGAKASISVEASERLLYSSHMILATILRTQELALSGEEAKELAKASAAVLAHYNTQATAKTLDWINLVQCACFIYVSRIIAIKARKSQEKAEKKQARKTDGPAPVPGSSPGTQNTSDPGLATTLYDLGMVN